MSADSIFKTRIQQNRDICSNCFRRTHITYRLAYRLATYDGEVVKERVDGDKYPKPRRPQKHVTERTVYPATNAGDSHEKYACPCGVFSNYGTIRPLDKRDVIEMGQRLVKEYRRLDGLVVDEDEFFDALRELKSDPDRQFQDDEIFDEATSRAVRRTANKDIETSP